MIDFLIAYEEKMQNGMGDPEKIWNLEDDSIKKLAKTLSDSHKGNVLILNGIKKELVPKCCHPKKMRDRSTNGQWYCMNCNTTL